MTSTARQLLIEETMIFAGKAIARHGVLKVALIGSLATDKANPKDTDLIVTISDDIDLKSFARISRSLQGRSQGFNRWADIFLVDESGEYLGRTCPWKECRAGIRASCQALHCGWRPHLHDDLQNIKLEQNTIKYPAVELWPNLIVRVRIPDDLKIALEQFQREHLPQKRIRYVYPKNANTNQFVSDNWSNPAAEDLFKQQWGGKTKIKKLHKAGNTCQKCAHYKALNENWGLCFQQESNHYLETIFKDFTCLRFEGSGVRFQVSGVRGQGSGKRCQ